MIGCTGFFEPGAQSRFYDKFPETRLVFIGPDSPEVFIEPKTDICTVGMVAAARPVQVYGFDIVLLELCTIWSQPGLSGWVSIL